MGWGYGNYCGWSKRGRGGPPIDELDAACKAHDWCLRTWQEAVRCNCCNIKLMKAAKKANCKVDINGQPRTPKEIHKCQNAKNVIRGPGMLITLCTLPL